VQSVLWLYFLAVVIWGSTWLVITFQLGTVAPEASVIYRFALASLILFIYVALKKQRLKFEFKAHRLFAAQGLLLFCINYILFYHAEQYISSGLVALICSALAFINIVGMRVFYGQPFARRVVWGSLLGMSGIVLVFWPEVAGFDAAALGWTGIGMSCIATLSASGGNLVSVAQRRASLPLLPAMAWAMGYGVLFSLIYAMSVGVTFEFDLRFRYVASLLYLVVFGSIVAFFSYLTLINRIGADKAAYVNVAVPIMALLLSSVAEEFRWQGLTYLGVALSLLGNLLVMYRPANKP
jgi:drug/metabolite transporter (DMT)-like permease